MQHQVCRVADEQSFSFLHQVYSVADGQQVFVHVVCDDDAFSAAMLKNELLQRFDMKGHDMRKGLVQECETPFSQQDEQGGEQSFSAARQFIDLHVYFGIQRGEVL